MEEGLEKESRRSISNLFKNYFANDEPININPELLNQEDQKYYYSIISSYSKSKLRKLLNR